MSLEHVFYLSQSIAAVAVIASLLYLAQQVRQAERVQRGDDAAGTSGPDLSSLFGDCEP
jgi:hypothetical protein